MKKPVSVRDPCKLSRQALTLKALADVDAGRTHDHTEIEAWAAGLSQSKRKTRR